MREALPINVENKDRNFFGNLSEEEVKAWQDSVPLYKLRAVDPESFSDIYNPDLIRSDITYVNEMEARFAQNTDIYDRSGTRRGELLEALIFEQLKYSKWFGVDATAVAVSRYDDIANGVDMVVQFIREQGFKFLALTIDVTSSPDKMRKKLYEIKKDILNGNLTKIKYFDPNPKSKKSEGSRNSGLKIRGELRDIPRVVVGIDRKSLQELSLLKISVSGSFRGSRNLANSGETRIKLGIQHREAMKAMLRHRIQFLILEQIKSQLSVFATFARANDHEGSAQQYDNDLTIINEVLAIKQNEIKLTMEETHANKNDEVFVSLKSGLESFK